MSTLGEAADFLSGGTPPKDVAEYWNGDIPWYSASNMGERFLSDEEPKITRTGLEAGSRLALKGATLLLVRGSGLFNYIPICFADKSVAFNQDVKAICPKRHVDPAFLHFWIESLRPILEGNIGVTGIGAGKFDLDFLKALPFPDIPKREQEVIGLFASSFDRKINVNRRMNETLQAMAGAFFKDWFVDFGPTRAKVEGRVPYLAPEMWALFPERFGDEDKPKGWDVLPLPEVFDFLEGPGIRNWQYTNSDEGTRFINIRCIKDHDLKLKTANRVKDIEANAKYAHFHLREDDIVVSTSGTLGRWALVRKEHLPLILNTSVIRFRPKKGISSLEYLRCYVEHPSFVNEIEMRAVGSVQKNFGPVHLKQMAVMTPPVPVGRAFSAICAPLFAQWKTRVSENKQLAECRALVLPKLLSGKMRLREAEKLVEKRL